jgi:hypothetical protein
VLSPLFGFAFSIAIPPQIVSAELHRYWGLADRYIWGSSGGLMD